MAALTYSQKARTELKAASSYYDRQRPGYGRLFLDAVERMSTLIANNPMLGHQVSARLRRVLVPRFPYAIIYMQDDDRVRVIAIAHTSRNPGYWQDRLNE